MIKKVIRAAKRAGRIMMQDITNINDKGNAANAVTDLDIKVEKFLKKELARIMPEAGFIGEESKEKNYNNEYLWIVDPIDGTMNFIRNMQLSAISIALIKNNKAILGVVYNPFQEELFWAKDGKGAYYNGEKISVSEISMDRAILFTAFSTYNKDFAQPCIDIMTEIYNECSDIRRLGTAAIELCYIAAGRADIYFEIRLSPWDYAAGCLILKEAGGYIGTIDYDELIYTNPIPIICGNTKENYKRLREIVLKYVPTIPYTE